MQTLNHLLRVFSTTFSIVFISIIIYNRNTFLNIKVSSIFQTLQMYVANRKQSKTTTTAIVILYDNIYTMYYHYFRVYS